MIDVDTFERDLTASLRRYAAEAPTLNDPAGFAKSIALEHPRRRGWLGHPIARTVGWVLLGVALILATFVALGIAGGSRPPTDPLLVLRNPTSGPSEPERVELVAGQRYDSMDFTEPFDFIMPFADPNMALAGEGSLTKGVLRLGNGDNWSSSFHDDVPVFADICDTGSAMLNDVPATPEDVGAWLRSSGDLIVSDPTELTVDGRIALAFMTTPLEGCESFDPPLGGTQFHLGNAVYAIPTGDDTILYVVWGVPRDDLVSSITFK